MLVTNQNIATTGVTVTQEGPITVVSAMASCAIGAAVALRLGVRPIEKAGMLGCLYGIGTASGLAGIVNEIPDGTYDATFRKITEIGRTINAIVENPKAFLPRGQGCEAGGVAGALSGALFGEGPVGAAVGLMAGCVVGGMIVEDKPRNLLIEKFITHN